MGHKDLSNVKLFLDFNCYINNSFYNISYKLYDLEMIDNSASHLYLNLRGK